MRHISKGVRLAAALMALLLPASFAVSAETAQAQRIYTVVSQGNSGQIFKEPQESTFLESPVLRAGEAREDGILRFVNEDKAAVDVWIRAVELPYDDEEALAYLSALRLRITDGETVLYDGPYTRAADEGGIRLRQNALARGSQKEYRVALYCDFAYTGEPVPCVVDWDVQATPSVIRDDIPAPKQPVWVLVTIGVAGALAILCAVLGATNLTKKRKENR